MLRSRAARALRHSLLALTAVLAVVLVSGILFVRGGLPQVAGTSRLPGLGAPVQVRRDGLGVPHLRAAAELDAWSAVGYVHAQDRFFQMDLVRRSAAGRLAEVFGGAALPRDRIARRLQMVPAAAAALASASSEVHAALEAYSRGVNAGLAATGPPIECRLLRYAPEPWSPLDSMLAQLAMEETLAWDGGEEERDALTRRLGPDLAAYLGDFQGMEGATVLEPGHDGPALPAGSGAPPATSAPSKGDGTRGGDDPVPGSNGWAIAGSRTASGRPLLANDPHLPLAAPSVFYQAHVAFPGVDVVGFTLPGVPFPVLGHNGRVAWGGTTLYADHVDLYALELDREGGDRFRRGSGFEPLELRTETIMVSGGDPETLVVKWSPFGPVIEEQGTRAVARDWIVYHGSRSAEAVLAFQRAPDAASFLRAARDFTSPGMNLVVADTGDHIGYFPGGAVPLRGSGDGRLPAEASDPAAGLRGMSSADEAPSSLDPGRGYLVTANNRIGTGPRAMRIGGAWAPPFRADRIVARLEARERHDVRSQQEIQNDAHSTLARRLLMALPEGPLPDPLLQRWWFRLRTWDGSYVRGSEPLVFELLERELRCAVFADEAGPLCASAGLGLLKASGAYAFEGVPPELAARDWFDDGRTPARETREAIVSQALARALERARELFGRDEAAWGWERIHTARLAHPLGRLPVVGRLLNLGPFPVPGCPDCVNAMGGGPGRRFRVASGPAFRMVIDLGDVRRSVAVSASGQSGHFLSAHYGDQAEAWAEGRAYPMLYAEEDVARATVSTLELRP